MNSLFQTSFRIYVEDTDTMGIVYHANYLRFFERARTEMLRTWGYSLRVLADENVHFAIHSIQMDFLSPARLDDWVTIGSKIKKTTLCSMLFEQTMQNQDNRVLCNAEISVVCVNHLLKPCRLPQKCMGEK